ncbi:MAG: hypothetical protein ABIQ31_19265 [Ferruginibacter sp.]
MKGWIEALGDLQEEFSILSPGNWYKTLYKMISKLVADAWYERGNAITYYNI